MGFHVAQTQKIPPSDGGRRKVKKIFFRFFDDIHVRGAYTDIY